MDSVNSGMSLQSSSGAEEECDSQSITTTTNIYQLHQPPPPPPPFNHHIYNNTSNQINNLNPNPTFFSPTPQHQQQLDSVFWSKNNNLTTTPEPITPIIPTTLNPNPHLVNPTKNPKKRSRASRKAPTTVLTTDTSNFRAMVQEFTGIPAPPFITTPSSSPLFPPRLSSNINSFDLFSRPSFLPSSSMNMRFVNNNNQLLLFDNNNNNPFSNILFQSSSSSS
uniref:VQ motif-containing protein 22-like n=1 Tax=Erigeron canadensis TaxID=72917 RepID=UPI001CB9C843